MRELAHTIFAGLKLSLGMGSKSVKGLRPMAHFWWVFLLGALLSFALQLFQFRDYGVKLRPDGLLADAFLAMLCLGVCTLILHQLRKGYLAFSLACLLLVAQWLPSVAWVIVTDQLGAEGLGLRVFYLMFTAYALWFGIAIFAALGYLKVVATPAYRAAIACMMLALMIWPYLPSFHLTLPRYVNVDDAMLFEDEAAMLPPEPAFDAEGVMYAQREQVERELARIRPSVAGLPELFVVSLAGDGKEDTFLNEAIYAKALFSERFGASQRVLLLANHPDTTRDFPLASLSNLRASLKGLSKKMHPEDVLLLFMTSHGAPGPGHEFALDLLPLPLNQINPKLLAGALKASAIEHQWVVVSACYSGGYLDALATEHRIVMTAARADRTSFGCGNTQDLTYFGKAFLLDALNQHGDLLKAFQVAQDAITAREKTDGFEPSMPQIRIGEKARTHLLTWKKSFEPGDPVPFFARSWERPADGNALK
jgi:Peptidase C13 family